MPLRKGGRRDEEKGERGKKVTMRLTKEKKERDEKKEGKNIFCALEKGGRGRRREMKRKKVKRFFRSLRKEEKVMERKKVKMFFVPLRREKEGEGEEKERR